MTKRAEDLRAEWLQDIMLNVITSESEWQRRRNSRLFVEIWKDHQKWVRG